MRHSGKPFDPRNHTIAHMIELVNGLEGKPCSMTQIKCGPSSTSHQAAGLPLAMA